MFAFQRDGGLLSKSVIFNPTVTKFSSKGMEVRTHGIYVPLLDPPMQCIVKKKPRVNLMSTKGVRRVWPVSRGYLLRGTWSYLRICRGLCCPTLDFVFAFWIMMTFDTFLTSLLCITATRAIFQLSGGCHHYRWQGCKFRLMLST
jgi:hypothetical protein